MKLFVLSIIALCVFYIGYLISCFFLKQLKIYNELLKFCEILINQIKFNKNQLNKIVDENLNLFQSDLKNILNDYFILKKNKVKSVYLLNSDEEFILNFFNSLGHLDVYGEITNLENYKTLINLKLNEKTENNKKYGALAKKLGALLGLLLFIILL